PGHRGCPADRAGRPRQHLARVFQRDARLWLKLSLGKRPPDRLFPPMQREETTVAPTDRPGATMRSDVMKSGPDRAPARAMLHATGLDDAALAKPLVAVVHTWSNVSPCNLNLRD